MLDCLRRDRTLQDRQARATSGQGEWRTPNLRASCLLVAFKTPKLFTRNQPEHQDILET